MTEGATSAPRAPADGRTLALLLGVPIALRLALLAVEAWRGQAVLTYVEFSDASSFLGVARAILDPAQVSTLSYYDTRVFPLWPAVEALLLTCEAPKAVLLLFPILLSAVVCWLYYRVTGHLSAALLLACAPPVWLLATLHPMSEAFYLLLGMLAALALAGKRVFLAGLLAGLMVATRPFGIAWVAAGAWAVAAEPASWRRLVSFGAGVALGGAVLVALNLHLYGDIFHQVRVYDSNLASLNVSEETARKLGNDSVGHWGPPFWHVLTTPWRVDVPAWKTAYIYAHLAALVVLAALAIRRLRRVEGDVAPAEKFLLLAFLFNGALILCTGPYWGFHSFDRYFLWGIPGALIALASVVPASAWRWVLVSGATGSLAATVFALHRLHP